MSDTFGRRKDGTTNAFEENDMILYIPHDLLMGERSEMVQHKNLGIVKSTNENFVFVEFINTNTKQGVKPTDLFFVHTRPDLEKIITDSLEK